MNQPESNNSIAIRLAAALNANRTTLLRYLDKGMPDTEPEARQWILAFKSNKHKTRATKTPTTVYPTIEITGDDSASRLQRLKTSELRLASEIAGIEQQVLPELASRLFTTTGAEKSNLERQLFQAQQTLLTLRKESRTTQKLLHDIEARTLAAREGLISFTWVLDCMSKCFMPLYSFLRSIDVEGEENTISKELTRRYIAAFDNYIRKIQLEPRNEQSL